MSLPVLLSVEAAAAYLSADSNDVTPRFVEDQIRAGRIKAARIAGRWKVTESALATYVEQGGTRRRSSSSETGATQVTQFRVRTRRKAS